jgi:type I restriction enzyme R subunit
MEIRLIKEVAIKLLKTLKAEKLRVDHWQDKEATRDTIWVAIRDFLYDDTTGLPVDKYTEAEVYACSDEVYHHVYPMYPKLPSPYYTSPSTA